MVGVEPHQTIVIPKTVKVNVKYHPPPPSYPRGRCGIQAAGRTCPTGLCCSNCGWCGTKSTYCSPGKCQSQCKTTLTSSFQNRMKSFYFSVV
ncbi:hypothetical protein MTR67_015204 [Solanum verrucosum]|uniref:Chitin-binding type-1 domain-containing protein n=1 Tax=Solanum verrucosum TaxID=315347 RepID=A0AAF0TJW3_SOLVR|nr:hypothetical protein MTR67_015204 [Solanum verrucosum]